MNEKFRILAGAVWLAGCGASGDEAADGPPAFSGTPSFGGTGSPGSAGALNPSPGAGQGGMGATQGSSGGLTPAGNGGTGFTPEGNSGGGPIAPSNGGTGSGNAGSNSGGSGGTGNPPGNEDPGEVDPGDGDFVSVPVNGGASAAFVCPDGASFGNPLAGMSAVTSVAAPQGGFFAFIEGPVWVGSVNRLFFSDNAPPERIFRLDPPFTTPVLFMADSGSNGLALDNGDRLLLADQSDRRITRVNPMTAQIIEDVLPSGGPRPNDLILRSDENLYFTDPESGFYRVSPSGQLSGPFRQGMQGTSNAPGAPNGIVLSPDENTLYVGDVQQRFVAAFDLEADGAIDTQSGRVFVRTTGDTVDGMAVDCAGNLYVGTRTGVEVYAPDASFIGNVPTGESSNATFGGPDRRTLFVTSRSVLKLVTLAVPGLPD